MKLGLICILGSGETLASSGKTHEYVAQRLPDEPNIVILETPAGFEPNSADVATKIKTFLERRLQNYKPQIDVLVEVHESVKIRKIDKKDSDSEPKWSTTTKKGEQNESRNSILPEYRLSR